MLHLSNLSRGSSGSGGHQQATDTAEDIPHSDTRSVTGAKNPMTDPTTAVDVTVIYLHG